MFGPELGLILGVQNCWSWALRPSVSQFLNGLAISPRFSLFSFIKTEFCSIKMDFVDSLYELVRSNQKCLLIVYHVDNEVEF